MKKTKQRKMTEAQIKKIKALSKKGVSERQIAKQLKCARSTVWYWLQK